jgi:hypothetical protein
VPKISLIKVFLIRFDVFYKKWPAAPFLKNTSSGEKSKNHILAQIVEK